MRRMLCGISSVLAFAFAGAVPTGAAAGGASDPALLAALRADEELAGCRCILAAKWLNESYPRVTVEDRIWKKFDSAGRTRFGVRALRVAEAAFFEEFGIPDQYEQIFIVDRHGSSLSAYPP